MNVEDLVKHVITRQNSLLRANFDNNSDQLSSYETLETQSPAADELDYFATEDEVLHKIEQSILWMSSQIDNSLPLDLSIAAPSSRSLISSPVGGHIILGPTQATQTLSTSKPQKAARFARALAVMRACHSVLKTGCSISQRSLWYRLKTNPLFRSAPQVGEAVQDVISLLQVPRSSLGIVSSSKGLVAGNLIIQDSRSGQHIDCSSLPGASSSSSTATTTTTTSTTSSGSWSIPGDLRALDYLSFDSNATVMLIIEKETIFQTLLQSNICQTLPCILLTGRGYPDLATRKFARELVDAFPHLLTLALVDWNPCGVQICMLYKFGSKRMLESTRFAIPSVKWLGVRSDMLLLSSSSHDDDGSHRGDMFQTMSSRDVALAGNLSRELAAVEPAWVEELRYMVESESKAEMEALYADGNTGTGNDATALKDIFVNAIHQGNYI